MFVHSFTVAFDGLSCDNKFAACTNHAARQHGYSGKFAAALTTASALVDYDDLVDPIQVYSIYALSAIASKRYDLCSKAFTKLESLPGLTEKQREHGSCSKQPNDNSDG